MSLLAYCTVTCDGQGCLVQIVRTVNLSAIGPDLVAQIRDELQGLEWSYHTIGDRDLCPECTERFFKEVPEG